jgi:hypothetical protein
MRPAITREVVGVRAGRAVYELRSMFGVEMMGSGERQQPFGVSPPAEPCEVTNAIGYEYGPGPGPGDGGLRMGAYWEAGEL